MKLGDISPLAGMLTGEGLTGKLMAKGFGGVLPSAIARDAQKRREEEEAAAAEEEAAARAASGMKKGGKTKGYAKGGVTRADGCITKGHTKGKMR